VSSKKKRRTTQSTKVRPNAEYKSYIDDVFSRADAAYLNNPKRYEGRLEADFNENQLQGHAGVLREAPSLSAGADELRRLGVDTAAGKYLNFDASPIGNYFDTLQRQQRRAFDEQVQRRIDDTAIQAGAYGGSRQGVEQAIAERGYQDDLQNRQNALAFANFQAERQHQQNAHRLLQEANKLKLAPHQARLDVGDREQEQARRLAQEEFNLFDINRQLSWQDAINFANIVAQQNPVGIGYDSTTSTTERSKSGGSLQAIKAVAGLGLAYYGATNPAAAATALPAAGQVLSS